MEKKVHAKSQGGKVEPVESLSALERIARLLAILATAGKSQGVQAAMLRSAGFGVAEIAEILDIPPNQVSVAIYQLKQKIKKKPDVKAAQA